MTPQASKSIIWLTVLVSALGYFVDIYDLLLFGIVRVPSLRALGVSDADMLSKGVMLLNSQMAGMLLGGILWGVIGDKHGRKSVLFGSILLYSASNIANAFVTNVAVYAGLRFLAGLGLAGELGAAVTLVAEVMTPSQRGFGTTLVAGTGILGAVLAALIGDLFHWQVAFIVGGVMGLGLLGLRAGLLESSIFQRVTEMRNVPRGAFLRLFSSKELFLKYLCCILIGVPIWFVIGILVTFAPEITNEFGVRGSVTASHSILWTYVGGSIGGLAAGFLSQILNSRKKAILVFLVATGVLIGVYLISRGISSRAFYFLCLLLGMATGYWSVFVTNAAEQFGTNMRATAAITVPNFVRGSVVPMTMSFNLLRGLHGTVFSLSVVGFVTIGLAMISLANLSETYGRDLNAVELL